MCLVHLSFLPWEFIVFHFLGFSIDKVTKMIFGFVVVLVNKVLIFIMVLLLRLVYILRIPHNLLLIIGVKEVRYKVPLEIL